MYCLMKEMRISPITLRGVILHQGNAEAQLRDIDFSGSVKKYGILRAYTTRHGYGHL